MVAIVFPPSTAPGVKTQESGGRHVNAHYERLQVGASAKFVLKRAPGLVEFADTEEAGFRGCILVGANLFVAYEDELVYVTSGGTVTSIGTLGGTGPVYFASNNAATPDVVVVTEEGIFDVTTSSITEITDPDLPQPNSICFQDSFLFPSIADGRVFASGQNDTTFAGTDYTAAEAKTDSLLRVVSWDSTLYMCGDLSIEAWSNTAEATGFPFSRTTVIYRGLIGPRAIAGWEDGFQMGLVWVADDCSVRRLSGYTPQRISPPEIERLIEAVADKSTLEASVYSIGGHPCWVLSSPDWTWVFDLATEAWHERRSYNMTRWRCSGGVYAFGKWLTFDRTSGKIYEITESAFDEAGEPLVWEVESAQMGGFPRPVSVPRADFKFVAGTGEAEGVDPIEVDPSVSISWTDDAGVHWSHPLIRKIGRQQVTRGRITVLQTGTSGPQGRRWRLTVADPVYVSLLGGDMAVSPRGR